WIDEHVVITTREDAALHTETVGSVVDRLAIAWVRTRRFGELESPDNRVGLAEAARRQFSELAGAYDDLVREVSAGGRDAPREAAARGPPGRPPEPGVRWSTGWPRAGCGPAGSVNWRVPTTVSAWRRRRGVRSANSPARMTTWWARGRWAAGGCPCGGH